jgi:hypothetical protein
VLLAVRSKQRKLFRARKPRSRELHLRRPTKGCPQCENLRGHSNLDAEGRRYVMPPTQCAHRGRPYVINGTFRMVLCVCCARRLRKRSPLTSLKEDV